MTLFKHQSVADYGRLNEIGDLFWICLLSVCILCIQIIPGSAQAYRSNPHVLNHESIRVKEVVPFPLDNYPKSRRAGLQYSIDRFATVEDCLKRAGLTKSSPDLRQFDWDRMRNDEDVSVCLYRVANVLNEYKKFEEWFRSQGFETNITRDSRNTIAPIILSADWHVKLYNRRLKFPTYGIFAYFSNYIVYGQSIVVYIQVDGSVSEIIPSLTIK